MPLFWTSVLSACATRRCRFRTNLVFDVSACLPPFPQPGLWVLQGHLSPDSMDEKHSEKLWLRSSLAVLPPLCPRLSTLMAIFNSEQGFFFFFKARQWLPLQLYHTLNGVLFSRVRSLKLSPESGNQLIPHKTLFLLYCIWMVIFEMCSLAELNVHGMAKCHQCHCHWDAGATRLQGGEWPNGRCQDNRSDDEWTLPPTDGGARARDVQEPQHQ